MRMSFASLYVTCNLNCHVYLPRHAARLTATSVAVMVAQITRIVVGPCAAHASSVSVAKTIYPIPTASRANVGPGFGRMARVPFLVR
jgi:hypothetical protein